MYSRSIPALSARDRVVNESRAVLTAALSSVTYPPLGIRRLAVSRQTIISKNLPQEKPFYLVLDKGGPVGHAASNSHVCRSFLFSFTGQADVLFKFADNRLAPEAGRIECLYNNTGLEWDVGYNSEPAPLCGDRRGRAGLHDRHAIGIRSVLP